MRDRMERNQFQKDMVFKDIGRDHLSKRPGKSFRIFFILFSLSFWYTVIRFRPHGTLMIIEVSLKTKRFTLPILHRNPSASPCNIRKRDPLAPFGPFEFCPELVRRPGRRFRLSPHKHSDPSSFGLLAVFDHLNSS